MAKKHPALAIVATGPSLKPNVVAYIKQHYSKIICVSNSFELFKDEAIALVASDGRWWDQYKPQFDHEKFCLTNPHKYQVRRDVMFERVSTTTNSGCFALIVARLIYKPKFIHLYGFDMNNKEGDHYFGPHQGECKNSDQRRFDIFKEQFSKEKKELDMAGITVVNCNKRSELECFKKLEIIYD